MRDAEDAEAQNDTGQAVPINLCCRIAPAYQSCRKGFVFRVAWGWQVVLIS